MDYNMHDSRKRHADDVADDGGAKRNPSTESLIVVRVVCPNDRSGAVIGKGGDVIRSIREGTGARVKVEESPHGVTDRSVIITSTDLSPGTPSSPAQEALKRVMKRICEDDTVEGAPVVPAEVEFKLLVDSVYVGGILGKGGDNINRIRSASKCAVTVVKEADKSQLAGQDENMIKITGSFEGAQLAAHLLVDKIREALAKGINPQSMAAARAFGASGTGAKRGGGGRGGGLVSDTSIDGIATEYRLLVPDARIGPIIGKGGEKMRHIREHTRAEVKVDRSLPDCPERLVICSSSEPVHSEWCGAAEALMMCADRVVADKAKFAENATIRLLAPGNQMGAILGVKGATIRQLHQDTGCKVVVLPRTQTPSVGQSGDEVLQLDGSTEQVLACLRFVTMMLRGIQIRQQGGLPDAGPISYGPGAFAPPGGQGGYQQAPQAQVQSYQPYLALAGTNAAGGPQFSLQYGSTGPASAPSAVNYQNPTSQGELSGGYTQQYGSYYSQPPAQVATDQYNNAPPPQQQYATYTPQQTAADPYQAYQPPQLASSYVYSPPPIASGPPALNTLLNPVISSEGLAPGMLRYTMQLPPNQVGTILGAKGSNISAIRLSSGAKIKVHDAAPNGDREVEISGTPSQVSHATSMAQTLMNTGTLTGR